MQPRFSLLDNKFESANSPFNAVAIDRIFICILVLSLSNFLFRLDDVLGVESGLLGWLLLEKDRFSETGTGAREVVWVTSRAGSGRDGATGAVGDNLVGELELAVRSLFRINPE